MTTQASVPAVFEPASGTRDTTHGISVPRLYAPSVRAAKRFLEFFAPNIRNPNTRRAYVRAAFDFADWCDQNHLGDLVDIEPSMWLLMSRVSRSAFPRRR